MNHPEREEWVPYLYGEARPEARRQLKEHLQQCAECREELDGWKRSLHRLDAWRLPRAASPLAAPLPYLKWAAAAVLVLGLGFGVGQLTARRGNVERLRAQLEPEIRQHLRQEVAEMVRQEVAQASAATLARAQRQAEEVGAEYYALLKKDLDTVAIYTDAGLQQTEQELFQIADYTQPVSSSKSNKQ